MDGNLVITTRAVKTQWRQRLPGNWFPTVFTKNYTSGMVQSWNKFCFTGGVLELSVQLPGDSDSGGLWPAAWMMGNLARATHDRSTVDVWPWSFNQCPTNFPYLNTKQEINACDGRGGEPTKSHSPSPSPPSSSLVRDWLLGKGRAGEEGMNGGQGRGSPEIDIFEVMPGHSMPSQPPLPPFMISSLQVSPALSDLHSAKERRDGTKWSQPTDGQYYPYSLLPMSHLNSSSSPHTYTLSFPSNPLSFMRALLNTSLEELKERVRVEGKPTSISPSLSQSQLTDPITFPSQEQLIPLLHSYLSQHHPLDLNSSLQSLSLDPFQLTDNDLSTLLLNLSSISFSMPFKSNHSHPLPPLNLTQINWYSHLETGRETHPRPNFEFWGSQVGPEKDPTAEKRFKYREDSVSLVTDLTQTHFSSQHIYRIEWEPGRRGSTHPSTDNESPEDDGGFIRWYLDDKLLFGISSAALRTELPSNSSYSSHIPSEPMYLILNTAVSHQWGFPEPCPKDSCDACWQCYDCLNPTCQCALPEGLKNCKSLPAEMKIDFIRLYQDPSNPLHTLGCSPPSHPTQSFIRAHSDRYADWREDHLLPSSMFLMRPNPMIVILFLSFIFVISIQRIRSGVSALILRNFGSTPSYIRIKDESEQLRSPFTEIEMLSHS